MTPYFGLSAEALQKIKSVFEKTPSIQRVRVFGSRALGRERPGSDIDLALEGTDLDLDQLLGIRVKLDALFLPYRFDLVAVPAVSEATLSEHIERVGVALYERPSS